MLLAAQRVNTERDKMPETVAMLSPSLLAAEDRSRRRNPETKSGAMTLLGPDKRHRQPVHVKVYRTSLEHFAVLYPQKKVCQPLGVLNLRHASVARLSSGEGFVVHHKGCDAADASLTFLVGAAVDVDSWLDAFSSATTGGSAAPWLPALEEDEDEF